MDILMERLLFDVAIACGFLLIIVGAAIGWWSKRPVINYGIWKTPVELPTKGYHPVRTCPTEGWGDGECKCTPKCL